jgi:CRP-like cAMP-binding protein
MVYRFEGGLAPRRSETLERIALFRSLDVERVNRLDSQCSWRRATPNEWIINHEDENTDVFFVTRGAVRVKLQAVSGREVLLRDIEAGEFFGELAAIDQKPRSSGIMALTEVTIARMPASVFEAVVLENPDVCKQLLVLLAAQIRTLANRVNEFANLDGKQRIYAELLRLSKWHASCPNAGSISPPPSHSEIAARVSIRREAVGLELARLVKAGLLERRRGALILTDLSFFRKLIREASEAD